MPSSSKHGVGFFNGRIGKGEAKAKVLNLSFSSSVPSCLQPFSISFPSLIKLPTISRSLLFRGAEHSGAVASARRYFVARFPLTGVVSRR